MSIIFKSVELSNFRSHKHFIFEPEESGITAISGPNGAGKSSVVDAIAWSLYGVKPDGVSKASAMYRSAAKDFKKERGFVRLVFEVDGATLKVERRFLRASTVECDVWEYSENFDKEVDDDFGANAEKNEEDWKHIAGSAPTHAEAYIKRRLGMDAQGFLAAIFVQQKQVDQLIKSRQSDRAKVIERLTGISAISKALTAARQDYNEVKKQLDVLNVDAKDLAATKQRLQEDTKLLEKRRAEAKKFQKEVATLQSAAQSAKETYDNADTEMRKFSQLQTKSAQLSATIEARTEEFERAAIARKKAKSKLPRSGESLDLQKLTEKLRKAERKLQSTRTDKTNLERELRKTITAIQEAKSTINTSDETCAKDTVESEILQVNNAISNVESEISKYEIAVVEHRSRVDQLQSAVTILGAGEACPTCLQTVADSNDAIKGLQAMVQELETTINESTKKKKSSENLLQKHQQRLQQLQNLADAYNVVQDGEAFVKDCQSQLNALSVSEKTEEVEVRTVSSMQRKAEQFEELRENYQEAHQYAQQVSESLEKVSTQFESITSQLQAVDAPTEKQLMTMRKDSEKATTQYHNAEQSFNKMKSDGKLLAAEVKHLESDFRRKSEEMKLYKEVLATSEVAASSVHVLDEFRAERTRTALPAIASYASQFVSRFTDGAFTSLKMDEKFNATVVLANGTERQVGLLSGGELSAVALALRLAISLLLNGAGTKNSIVLDEVLVSQDEARSERILSTIKDVCQGQIILIAHNENIDAIADKMVELRAL